MLTGAELLCIDINHLEELRICLAPATRTPHPLSRQHPSNICFRTETFLVDLSIVENNSKQCSRVRNYSASTLTIWKKYEFASLPLREPPLLLSRQHASKISFRTEKLFGRPFDCGEQIRTMLTGAELFCIDINHLEEFRI